MNHLLIQRWISHACYNPLADAENACVMPPRTHLLMQKWMCDAFRTSLSNAWLDEQFSQQPCWFKHSYISSLVQYTCVCLSHVVLVDQLGVDRQSYLCTHSLSQSTATHGKTRPDKHYNVHLLHTSKRIQHWRMLLKT